MFIICYFASLQEFTMHDTIGCYLDLDKGQISFSKNGAASVVKILIIMIIYDICKQKNTHVSFPILCFLPPGNDLGVAFDIPQHVKNQPFFASCVLKVSHQHSGRLQTNKCHIYTIQIAPLVICLSERRAEVQLWRR